MTIPFPVPSQQSIAQRRLQYVRDYMNRLNDSNPDAITDEMDAVARQYIASGGTGPIPQLIHPSERIIATANESANRAQAEAAASPTTSGILAQEAQVPLDLVKGAYHFGKGMLYDRPMEIGRHVSEGQWGEALRDVGSEALDIASLNPYVAAARMTGSALGAGGDIANKLASGEAPTGEDVRNLMGSAIGAGLGIKGARGYAMSRGAGSTMGGATLDALRSVRDDFGRMPTAGAAAALARRTAGNVRDAVVGSRSEPLPYGSSQLPAELLPTLPEEVLGLSRPLNPSPTDLRNVQTEFGNPPPEAWNASLNPPTPLLPQKAGAAAAPELPPEGLQAVPSPKPSVPASSSPGALSLPTNEPKLASALATIDSAFSKGQRPSFFDRDSGIRDMPARARVEALQAHAGLERIERSGILGRPAKGQVMPSEALRLSTGTAQRVDRNLFDLNRVLDDHDISTVADRELFEKYLAAREAVQMAESVGQVVTINGKRYAAPQHYEMGLRLDDAREVVGQLSGRFEKAAQDFSNVVSQAEQRLIDAGGLSPEAAEAGRKLYPFYLPKLRALESSNFKGVRGGSKTISTPRGTYKLTEGGKTPLLNPYEAVYEHLWRLNRAADMARPASTFIDMWKQAYAKGDATTQAALREVAYPAAAKAMDMESIASAQAILDAAREAGMTITPEVANELATNFTQRAPTAVGNNISIWQNGQRELWAINDEVARAFRAYGPRTGGGLIGAFLRLPAAAVQVGVTHFPTWPIMNWFADQFAAVTQSKYGLNPWTGETLAAYRDLLRLRGFGKGADAVSPEIKQFYREFQSEGGGFGMMRLGSGPGGSVLSETPGTLGTWAMRRAGLEARDRLVKGGADATLLSRLEKDPFRYLRERYNDFIYPAEESTRFAEFVKGRKKGASIQQAALAARDVTTDFLQRPASDRVMHWEQMVPFMRASMLSLERMARAIHQNPAQYMKLATANVAGMSAAIWAYNEFVAPPEARDKIRELRRNPESELYWYVATPLPGNPILKLKKPFLLGQMFGTSAELALDKMFADDPRRTTEMAQDLLGGMLKTGQFPLTPPLLNVGWGLYSNTETFGGRPIEPAGTEQLAPQYRAKPTTPELVSRAYEAMPFLPGSPAKFDFVVRQLTGLFGPQFEQLASNIADNFARGNNPVTPWIERQFADRAILSPLFARYPTSNTASLNEFYDGMTKATQAARTRSFLMRSAPQKLAAWDAAHAVDIRLAPLYASRQMQMATQHQQIARIRSDYSISLRERDARIGAILQRMNDEAKQFNEAVRGLRAND